MIMSCYCIFAEHHKFDCIACMCQCVMAAVHSLLSSLFTVQDSLLTLKVSNTLLQAKSLALPMYYNEKIKTKESARTTFSRVQF